MEDKPKNIEESDKKDNVPNFDEISILFKEVHSYFSNNPKLNQIKIKNEDTVESKENLISKFKIDKSDIDLFENISSNEDIDNVIKEIQAITEKYLNNISDVLNQSKNESKEDENVKKAINAMINAILNFRKNIKKINRGVEEDLSIDKNIEKIMDNFSKLIEDRIIKDCIAPIYQGMKYSNNNLYDNLLICLNEWLKNMGIYTIEIEEGSSFDDSVDYITPLGNEITKDYKLDGTIKELTQYPYLFNESVKICDGKAIYWRFE